MAKRRRPRRHRERCDRSWALEGQAVIVSDGKDRRVTVRGTRREGCGPDGKPVRVPVTIRVTVPNTRRGRIWKVLPGEADLLVIKFDDQEETAVVPGRRVTLALDD